MLALIVLHTSKCEEHVQFIGVKEHNRESSLSGALAAVGVIFSVGSVFTLGGHRTRFQESLRKNLFIAEDGRPRGEAAKTRKIVIASFCVELCDTSHGLFAVQFGFGIPARRLALSGRLLGGLRCSVGLRGSSALVGFFRIGRFSRCVRLFSSGVGRFLLVLLRRCAFCMNEQQRLVKLLSKGTTQEYTRSSSAIDGQRPRNKLKPHSPAGFSSAPLASFSVFSLVGSVAGSWEPA